MMKLLHYILLALLAILPLGLSALSNCDVETLLTKNAHHHTDSLDTTNHCTETSDQHHSDTQTPCDDECSTNLPDAFLAKTSQRIPTPQTTQKRLCDTPTHPHNKQHTLLFKTPKTPPDRRHRATSPAYSSRFLI